MKEIDILIEKIIGAAFDVQNKLGHGFLEKVYENSLAIELNKKGLNYQQQYPVYYEEYIWLEIMLLIF